MSRNRNPHPARALGLLGVALGGGLLLAGQAFASQPLAQGYLVSAGHAAAKAAEGKCGEGKCGEESFAQTDADHDGKVSREEFVARAPARAAEFDGIDKNHDGSISLPEALESVKAARKAAGKPIGEGKCGEGKCGGKH
ncbi:EF-hand domain-containing protein [Lysobacter sp. K5869]|uniref:EF-hand domain-containing protein n=1 Tax=Lysobacter sp. K5869 TaxID=2820808 RepID=UPI001C0647FC|nr:EF-hand domain-containing protein [Lysobacter sp. K5869]QWP74979.1 EF-hand domain-containing protein [Lysobacter sp. K5869]